MKLLSTHSRWAWTLFLTMGVVVCLINFFALPWGDELFYAFGGMTQCVQVEPEATYPRIATLADIVRQQYVDYTNGVNGRVWLHAIVAFFSGFKLYWLFDILNSAMWFLLGWLLLREGHIQKGSLWNYLFVLSASWWFLWYADTCSMCSAFAVNYLWMACATIVMMALWRRWSNRWWLVPVAFFYGWGQETFTAPMIAALFLGCAIRSVATRRVAITWQQAIAWLAMVVGFLCLLNGSLLRTAEKSSDGWIAGLLEGSVRVGVLSVLHIWPVVLALMVAWILWRSRKTLWALISRSPEWWSYLFVAGGLACMTMNSMSPTPRLMYAALLAGVLIILLERKSFYRLGIPLRKGVVVITTAWMVYVAGMQVWLGFAGLEMLRFYRADPAGITCFPAIPMGPTVYSAYSLPSGSMGTFQFEFEKGAPPTILTPRLYETLYQGGWERFVAEAQELAPGSGLYAVPETTQVIVMRGDAPITDEQQQLLENFFRPTRFPTGVMGFILVRLRPIAPPEDQYVQLNSTRQTLALTDGNVVTLFSLPHLGSFQPLPDWRTSMN